MAKVLSPEVLALIPDGIENLVLRCVVCGEPLPPARRTIGDHAGACHKVRVLYRKHIMSLTKCISCLHPSSPAEREHYKSWRKSRGDIREKCGKPKKALDKSAEDFTTPASVVAETSAVEKPQ